ncbi:nucleoside diphosphate kinase b, putative [Plasmodium knowlesi strain H]|uniref:Nucleoside diphosphate kinase n=3 Tax=Plasmodium knowlesi TaxID=5850 RepID=A0A5K1U1M2_PLAKH|nr:nucleoside diphosphate kinase b, putative [Plasmodium knowlesi strain H]OTN64490.1 Nucleoside diphosphate kinase [Plasmodium knowlesi]CAA9988877.1 nucleoside diphosphate kinase b, putative [Plasmodium knowlesi strain H]SBO24713.1 nucleoside diphosphate kinase b, putative [Plasmodium knowlesi strain H]SBO27986.1 nucleoside diphosphate kinase b, putative [Plasmodium knowlesi strain H]VVS78351.1 nucleoside diphosphate kinase b, putative [Plasmodium knowlesi strain H]|eukprot:XP_002261223.1 nucleoside diphosphate kinase b, putative [Plasmodium knowlesi strain H]
MEKSFIMVKPDGVQRGLVGTIIKRFEKKGYKMIALKMLNPTKEILKEHYKELADKPFFNTLVEYISKGPVVAMVWEGAEIVNQGRKLIGETNPLSSNTGTIRGDFCLEVSRNVIHGSDSVASANREINIWFKADELVQWSDHSKPWIYA